jgi:hypothetical protein
VTPKNRVRRWEAAVMADVNNRPREHHDPGVEEAPDTGRISPVRNMETVRHEALRDRVEVRELYRWAVAAARLKLREA